MSTDNLQIKFTLDGSPTLYRADIDEHYHSVKGALAESLHVFIHSGLEHFISECLHDSVSVLEIGLGTGLNAALTAIRAEQKHLHVDYFAFEPFPPSEQLISAIHYSDQVDELMLNICRSPWGTRVEVTPWMTITKIQAKFPIDSMPEVDVVYYDAFSPERQPELWTPDLFSALYRVLRPGGVLTTYCAKGVVRRTLESCGFTVERLAGPVGGKREILRATKCHGQS